MPFIGAESSRHIGFETTDIHLFNPYTNNVWPKYRRNATCVGQGIAFVWVESQVVPGGVWSQTIMALLITVNLFDHIYQGPHFAPVMPGIPMFPQPFAFNGVARIGYPVRWFRRYTAALVPAAPLWYHQSSRPNNQLAQVMNGGVAGVPFSRLKLGGHMQQYRMAL
ncbi:hypothetical protein C8R46DRAFT_1221972 [Mycena filopes]|nr:hypothetical protein C8R46DRAFT_1221972 [Mycena filopes]